MSGLGLSGSGAQLAFSSSGAALWGYSLGLPRKVCQMKVM